MAKAATKAVEKQEKGGVPAAIADIMGAHAGQGVDFDPDQITVPIFNILNDLSPQVKKGDPRYMDGAEAGDFFLTTPPTVLHKPTLVFLGHAAVIQSWRDRKAGGGFVAAYRPGEEPSGEDTFIPDGEYIRRLKEDPSITLVDSIQYIALVIDEEGTPVGTGFVTFKSTGLKHAKKLNAQIVTRKITMPDGSRVTPPIWGLQFPVETAVESSSGNSWHNWKIGTGELISDVELLERCRDAAADIDPDVFYRVQQQQQAAE